MLRGSGAGRPNRRANKIWPPNPPQWGFEKNGLDLRDRLGLDYKSPLSVQTAFRLLPQVDLVRMSDLPVAAGFLAHFRTVGRAEWSALCLTVEGGRECVLFNDSHSRSRIRATLMEEFFHLWLGHPRSALRLAPLDSRQRSLMPEIEQEAYFSGAAALVPYYGLHALVMSGASDLEIAHHFDVSPDLVRFRSKLTKLYRRSRGTRRRRAG